MLKEAFVGQFACDNEDGGDMHRAARSLRIQESGVGGAEFHAGIRHNVLQYLSMNLSITCKAFGFNIWEAPGLDFIQPSAGQVQVTRLV